MRVKIGFFVELVVGAGYNVYDAEEFRSATITSLEVKVGDSVKRGQTIAIIEADKVERMKLPAFFSGKVVALHYQQNESWERAGQEKTPFGELILPELGVMETEDIAFVEIKEEAAKPPEVKEAQKVYRLSGVAQRMAEQHGITEKELVERFSDANRITKADIETYIEERKSRVPTPDPVNSPQRIPNAVPAARRLARENNINLRDIVGSGRDGLIICPDVEKAVAARAVSTPSQSPPTTQMRRAIADMLTLSLRIPQAGDEKTINVTALKKFRDNIKTSWQDSHKTPLMYDHFIMYAVVRNLRRKEYLVLNAYWDEEQKKIVYVEHVNLGIAVASPKGLVIPVVHHAELLSFVDLVQQVNDKITRARKNELMLPDLLDLTFTLNRVAYYSERHNRVIGGEAPHSLVPCTRSSERKIRPTGMILSLGIMQENNNQSSMKAVFRFDHRLVDGTTPLEFVVDLQEFIEKSSEKDFTKILTA